MTKTEPKKEAGAKLSHCPFCGEASTKKIDHLETIDAKLVSAHWLYCRTCGASGPTRPTMTEAVDGWNARY